MPLKLIWSNRAKKELANIVRYLVIEWTENDAKTFKSKMERVVKLIEKNPQAYKTISNDVHQAVISKQSSLFYRISGKKLFIISLFDTRQNPKKMKL